VAEDLGQEDVVGLVFGLEPVAADGAVGASEVARFPGLVQGTEGAFRDWASSQIESRAGGASLLFDVFDVSELGPTSNITAFRRTLNLHEPGVL
jgi:hypothetical protein